LITLTLLRCRIFIDDLSGCAETRLGARDRACENHYDTHVGRLSDVSGTPRDRVTATRSFNPR
jgi:hypothetical protein